MYFELYPLQSSWLTWFGFTYLTRLAVTVAWLAGCITEAWLDVAMVRPAMARMGVITSTQADRRRINVRPLMRVHLSLWPAPRLGQGSTDVTVGDPYIEIEPSDPGGT